MTKRSCNNDPTPDETAQYFSDAVSALTDAAFDVFPAEQYPDYATRIALIEKSVTLDAIKDHIAGAMVAKGQAFSSDYRHEATPAHGIWYRILNGTVSVNARIWDKQKSAVVKI